MTPISPKQLRPQVPILQTTQRFPVFLYVPGANENRKKKNTRYQHDRARSRNNSYDSARPSQYTSLISPGIRIEAQVFSFSQIPFFPLLFFSHMRQARTSAGLESTYSYLYQRFSIAEHEYTVSLQMILSEATDYSV